jgi:hypothetical protein
MGSTHRPSMPVDGIRSSDGVAQPAELVIRNGLRQHRQARRQRRHAVPASGAAHSARPVDPGGRRVERRADGHTINPDVERFGYQRAALTMVEIESSHLVMLSHPKQVADLIRAAITGSSASDGG